MLRDDIRFGGYEVAFAARDWADPEAHIFFGQSTCARSAPDGSDPEIWHDTGVTVGEITVRVVQTLLEASAAHAGVPFWG